MSSSMLKLGGIKLTLEGKELNFKLLQDPDLYSMKDSVIFIDECSKVKLRGKIVRSFNEGEVFHWPLLNHENIAKLIDVQCIRNDTYIYMTIHQEITLKNIVHDENFVYDARCFDRKRSYAKGIFAGLSYLHDKSLTLRNLYDDNIVISPGDDRAVITNFEHLTTERKAIKSRLNVPEMYMAPETEKGEFDASKAEIWSSGVLMLDLFLAHMVPWAFVNFKPKEVIQIVDKLSLDLLQAANAGSIVTAADLAKFKTFLKCFFKQNPQERLPAKYFSTASFLRNRYRNKMRGDSYHSDTFPEYILSKSYSSLNLPEKDTACCSDPRYDPFSYYISPSVQNIEVLSPTNNPCISTAETQQTKRSFQLGENKIEVHKPISETSNNSIKVEKDENISSPSSNKFVISVAGRELNDNIQKMSQNWDSANKGDKSATKSSYNCYPFNSLSLINLERNSESTNEFHSLSERKFNSNNKQSTKQPPECDFQSRDFGLNLLLNNNDSKEIENNVNNNTLSNSVVERDSLNAVIGRNLSEIFNNQHVRNETQIMQHIPSAHTSDQISAKPFVEPPRNSKSPPLLLTPEIVSDVSGIVQLRKYYCTIQKRQKEFENEQKKIMDEWQSLILKEDFRLLEMLMKNYKLKFEDVEKLIEYVNERVSFSAVHRNSSCYRAIKNTDNSQDREWEINDQLDNRKSNEIVQFFSDCEMKAGCVTAFTKSDRMHRERYIDSEKIKLAKEYELGKSSAKTADDKNSNSGMHPKQTGHGGNGRVEMVKQHKHYEAAQIERYLNAVCDENCNDRTQPRNEKNKDGKKKKKEEKINTKAKVEKNPKEIDEKGKKKLWKSKQSVDEKGDKNVKRQRELEKHEESKRPGFFSMCVGGEVEELPPIIDTLCETRV